MAAPSTAHPATQGPALPATVRARIDQLRESGELGEIPATTAFAVGGKSIAPGVKVAGPVFVAAGPLVVEGTIEGRALVVQGDVIVRPGGSVTGDAISVGGRVRLEGGTVGGEVRSIDRPATPATRIAAAPPERTPAEATSRALRLTLGWFGILLIIGFGVLTFSEPALNSVVEALEEKFGRAFAYGLLAQLAAIPLLLLLVVALAISVIGILLIPFAVVAYLIGLTGLLVLGFVAVARFTGAALWREPAQARSAARGANLRALATGLALYAALWVASAAFTWSPFAGVMLRTIALAITWVALTLGLGAVVASRVMLRRARRDAIDTSRMADAMAWQTPTPITGVAAARRRPHVSRQDAVR
ncbi:MAG TPA: polymer-forming cytoskeletal protein [Gemmatimonadaceae bacterium]